MKSLKKRMSFAIYILLAVVLTIYVIVSGAMAWQYCEETYSLPHNTLWIGAPMAAVMILIVIPIWRHYR